jgi:hypothetical protein
MFSVHVDGRKLTICAVSLTLITLVSTWIITMIQMRQEDHPAFNAKQFLPTLSQTANFEPGRTIFAMGLTISAVLFSFASYLRFALVEAVLLSNVLHRAHVRRLHAANVVAVLGGLVYCTMFALVASFNSRDFGKEHVAFAITFFVVSIVHDFLVALIDWHIMYPARMIWQQEGTSVPVLSRRFAKLGMNGLLSVTAIVFLIIWLLRLDYNLFAIFEYLIMLQITMFWMSTAQDFEFFDVTLRSRLAVTQNAADDHQSDQNVPLVELETSSSGALR